MKKIVKNWKKILFRAAVAVVTLFFASAFVEANFLDKKLTDKEFDQVAQAQKFIVLSLHEDSPHPGLDAGLDDMIEICQEKPDAEFAAESYPVASMKNVVLGSAMSLESQFPEAAARLRKAAKDCHSLD